MLKSLKKTYHEYPTRFWVVSAARFVDGIGATLIFPFIALYITQKFGVGMTQAGVLIGVYSFSGLIGSMLGGRSPIVLGAALWCFLGWWSVR